MQGVLLADRIHMLVQSMLDLHTHLKVPILTNFALPLFCFSSSLCVCWPALGSCDLFITLSSSCLARMVPTWAVGPMAPLFILRFYLLLVHVYWPTDLSSIFGKYV